MRDVWTVSDDSLALSFYLLKVASILNHGRLALLFLKNAESVWLWQHRKSKAPVCHNYRQRYVDLWGHSFEKEPELGCQVCMYTIT